MRRLVRIESASQRQRIRHADKTIGWRASARSPDARRPWAARWPPSPQRLPAGFARHAPRILAASSSIPPRVSSCCVNMSTGKSLAHQCHGAVFDLGCAERFGVQSAGFLELERGFLRHAETEAARDHEQVHGVAQGLDARAPVALPGARQLLGRLRQCRQQIAILASSSRPAARCSSTTRCTTWWRRRWFRRRRAAARATSTSCMSGEPGVLHNATVNAPLSLRITRGREQVGALARLRDGDEQHAAQVRRAVVDRAHRRRGGRGEHLRVRLDEVLRVGCRVIRAAARAGDDRTRRPLAQTAPEFLQHACVVKQLRADDARAFGGFEEHPGRRSR